MTKQQFETFLEAKARETKTPDPVDWIARKQEWLKSLEMFYRQVELWLKDYLATGKIEMKRGDETLQEQHLGTYHAESLVLTIGMDRVVLQPIGTLLIGARGRVDMQGPKGTVKFILTGEHSDGIHVSISEAGPKGGAPAPLRKPRPKPSEEWVWKIATPPPMVRFIELTPESFFGALMEVVNG
jgi:hypothetical protein